MVIRLISKFHLVVKIVLFVIYFAKFFTHIDKYAFKIWQKICSKITHFSKQSEFRNKSLRLIFLFSLLFLLIYKEAAAAPVKVDAEINSTTATAQRAIEVIITISRDAGEEVDLASFTMEGKRIEVKHLNDSKHSSWSNINGKVSSENTLISHYLFTLSPREAGIHSLAPITVKVGNTVYQADAKSFQVIQTQSTDTFRLEALVEEGHTLYPGQHAHFIYRIYFQDNIELTVEDLPLLTAAGFKKIGEKGAKIYVEGDYQVQQITQEVVALKPGHYSFAQSVIEGYPYRADFFGRKIRRKAPVRAEAPAIEVLVESFPGKNKPAIFNGAIGQFALDVRLLTPNEVHVWDKVILAITISGNGEWETVQLGNLASNPSFKGLFRFSDLPPRVEQKEISKEFIIEMRPLSTGIKAIPSIEFAFFDPATKQYKVVKSSPIPLDVKPSDAPPVIEATIPMNKEAKGSELKVKDGEEEGIKDQATSIEIAGNYSLSLRELNKGNPWWKTDQVVWIIPLGGILIFLQFVLKKWGLQRVKKEAVIRSEELLRRALNNSEVPYGLIENALLLRLVEKGIIPNVPDSLNSLPKEGVAHEVHQFLIRWQESRFGQGGRNNEKVIQQARELFKKI